MSRPIWELEKCAGPSANNSDKDWLFLGCLLHGIPALQYLKGKSANRQIGKSANSKAKQSRAALLRPGG